MNGDAKVATRANYQEKANSTAQEIASPSTASNIIATESVVSPLT